MANDIEYELPYMPVEIARILLADEVLEMDFESFGAYCWLLFLAWRDGGLPNNEKRILAKLKLSSSKTAQELWNSVKFCFTTHPDYPGKLINHRQEIIRQEAIRKHVSAVDRGRKGSLVKRKLSSSRASSSKAQAVKGKSIKYINPPIVPPKGDIKKMRFATKDAELIYAAYPLKADRERAIKAILKALARISKRKDVYGAYEWLLTKTKEYAASPKGRRKEFQKYPATWFNAGSYDDPRESWEVHDQQTNKPQAATRSLPPTYDHIVRNIQDIQELYAGTPGFENSCPSTSMLRKMIIEGTTNKLDVCIHLERYKKNITHKKDEANVKTTP